MDKFTILVDSREQQEIMWPKDECYDQIITTKLTTGDYTLAGFEDKLIIERKANVAEIAQNITEDRFPRLLERMTAAKYKFMVFEFGLDDVMIYPVGSSIPKHMWNKIRIKPSFILSFLTKIQVRYGIHILFCGDRENAAIMTLKLMKTIYAQEKAQAR